MPGRGIGDGYPARIHLEVEAKGRVGVFGSRDFSFFLDEPAQDAGDIALPNGCVQPFRVVDSAGVPQVGVLVYARPTKGQKPEGTWWGYNQTVYQRSDAQGLVAGTVMPFGEVKVEIKGRSFDDTVLELTPTQEGETSRPIDLVVAPSLDSELIRGRVLDAAGEPVEGYALSAIGSPFDSNKGGWPSTRSRADGTFEISAAGMGLEGKLQLSHARNNRYDNWQELGSYRWGDNNIEVRLLASAKLQLLVRAGGKPVENLAVHAVPIEAGALGADPVRLAGTFRGGVVDLTGLRATRYAVRVHAIGSSSWPTDWIECSAEGAEPIVVDLMPPIERKLHVFTTEGRPVIGGRIELVVGGKPSWGVWGTEYYDRTMTLAGRDGQPWGKHPLIADRGKTDRQGAVLLRCIAQDEPVYVVVEGGGAQKFVHELAGWSEGRGPILVTVPGGGELRGTITPAAFVTALDASPATERKRFSGFGKTANAWRKSMEDFHADWRPSIALRDVQGSDADLIDLQGVLGFAHAFHVAGKATIL
jgi:hypothetical protein